MKREKRKKEITGREKGEAEEIGDEEAAELAGGARGR